MTDEAKKRHLFHFVNFLLLQKSLLHFHYLNLTCSIIVSVQNCDVLEFVKQLSKALAKFHGKNINALSAGRIFLNGGPTQFFIKIGV